MRSHRTVHLLLLCAVTIASGTDRVRAQASTAGTFVAIPESFPDIEARAMLVREPGIDLVILPDDNATVDALEMALLLLRDIRARYPAPSNGQMVPITGYVVTRPPSPQRRRLLQRTLSRLEDAEVVDLGTLGRGRRVRFDAR